MRKYDLGSSVFFFLCGVVIIIASLNLPLGSFSNPGPGLVPLIPGVLLSILSLAMFFSSFMRRTDFEEKRYFCDEGGKGWQMVIVTFVAILLYGITFEYLGFVITSFLLMVFLFKVAGKLKWPATLAGAVLATISCYAIFNLWLKVQFPRGLLGL